MVPLRLISAIVILIFVASPFVLAWTLWAALCTERATPDQASIMLPIRCIGGIELLAPGVISEHLGKLYVEAERRPRYFIEQTVDGRPDRI